MNRKLDEQLIRIYRLLYSKKTLQEQVTNFKVPNLADVVSDDVNEFFRNIQYTDTPLFQERYGSMKYKKSVESIQMGLVLLGYPLPKFGIDGLFGPETANAVNKFISDNNIKEEIQESHFLNEEKLMLPIPFQKVTSPYGAKRSYEIHPGVDLRAKSGTPILSPASGKVIDARFKEGACGGTIQVQHGGGFTSRYCHCKDIRVNIGQEVKQGDVLGLTGGDRNDKGNGNSKDAHLHLELKKNGKLVDPMDYMDKETGAITNVDKEFSDKAVITDKFIEVMLNKLKARGVKSEELKKLTNLAKNASSNISFEGDWFDISLSIIRKYERFSDIAKWDENAFRGGYGTDKKLVNNRLINADRNTTWTKEEAEETLNYEIKNNYAPRVIKSLGSNNWNKLNDKQKAVIVSMGYNAGPYFLTARDYGRKIKSAIENDNMEEAAKFIENGPTRGAVSGKYYGGLARRRKEEANIFRS